MDSGGSVALAGFVVNQADRLTRMFGKGREAWKTNAFQGDRDMVFLAC